MDENLAAQAELAIERQGVYDSLCYEGQWHTERPARRPRRQARDRVRRPGRPGPPATGCSC